ncbi:MAG: hypothetical protein ACI9QL_000749 [Candidatus Omnitrophota bacterium]|jgi:hypothetical protein
MKKTFNLIHPKIKKPRMVEAVRCELRKYVKRERRRALPKGVDFWDFNCKFGATEAEAKDVHLAEISTCITGAETANLDAFYVEILSKPGIRTKKPKPEGKGKGKGEGEGE